MGDVSANDGSDATLPRGQLKSSARPLGAGIASPLVSTRVATGSGPPAGRAGPPPKSSFWPGVRTVNGTTGPTSGRCAGPPGRPPGATAGSIAVGSATGVVLLAIVRWISRST